MLSIFDKSTQDKLLARVEKLSPASQRQWGKMNVSQMMKHLTHAFTVPLNPKHGPKENIYYVMANPVSRWLMFDVIPWPHSMPAPHVLLVKDDPEYEQAKTDFVQSMQTFLSAGSFPGSHPVFGEMDKNNWGKLMATHLDHHLRQFNV